MALFLCPLRHALNFMVGVQGSFALAGFLVGRYSYPCTSATLIAS